MTDLRAQLDQERRKVDVEYSDLTVRELLRMLEEAELNAAPAYQRKFRWTEEAESKLIESVLLGLPVPSLFVATDSDFRWEVVDGLQRLSTLVHFVGRSDHLMKQIDKRKPLVLQGLEKLSELNGVNFAELDEDLRLYFMRRTLRVTSLSDKSDLQVRFDLFERLNGGAVALTPQEVRACIYRGDFNDFLDELAADEAFGTILKLRANALNDGTREELVLKFFAYLDYRDHFRKYVTRFLNEYMLAANSSFDFARGRKVFRRSVDHLASVLDGQPFLRSGTNVTPLNQLEGVLVGIAEAVVADEPLVVPPAGWADDEKLVAASTKGTNTEANLRNRIQRSRQIFTGLAA